MQIRSDSLFARHSQQASQRDSLRSLGGAGAESRGSFLDMIGQGVGKVNEMQQSATRDVERMLAGEDVQSAEVLTGLQKADMAFRLMVQVRNKLMQAYEEINSIRV